MGRINNDYIKSYQKPRSPLGNGKVEKISEVKFPTLPNEARNQFEQVVSEEEKTEPNKSPKGLPHLGNELDVIG